MIFIKGFLSNDYISLFQALIIYNVKTFTRKIGEYYNKKNVLQSSITIESIFLFFRKLYANLARSPDAQLAIIFVLSASCEY